MIDIIERQYCMENFFKIISIGPFRMITQNKHDSNLSNACLKDLFRLLSNAAGLKKELPCGIYFAITHDLVIKRLIKIWQAKILVKIMLKKDITVGNLNRDLCSDYTKCRMCKNKKKCSIFKYLSKEKSNKTNFYLVVFKI